MAQAGSEDPIGVVIELTVAHPDGLRGAAEAVTRMIAAVAPGAVVRTSTQPQLHQHRADRRPAPQRRRICARARRYAAPRAPGTGGERHTAARHARAPSRAAVGELPRALADNKKQMRLGFEMTINDPGSAEGAITVGSTSARPHLSGVSYFSSKGPTGDGRLKPDLVAPGERVVSAGAGDLLLRARKQVPTAMYVEDSGTSMSAPHVSGVAAGFLSVHTEYVGRPDEVKRILLATATDLGRQVTFPGRGLVDAMRAVQAV